MAAQVGEIDKAGRHEVLFSDPLENRAEVCASTAFGFELYWF
jgi:hypothetical protein